MNVPLQVPGLTLYGNVMWFPDQFLLVHMNSTSQVIDKKLIQNMTAGKKIL